MKKFCKKISLLLAIGAAGTSIAQKVQELLPGSWGTLPRDVQLIILNDLTKDAFAYIKQLMISRTIKVYTEKVNSVGFNHDGSRIVFGASDGRIEILDVNDGLLIHTFQQTSAVLSVEFNHDGSRVVSGGETIKLWNADNGKLIKSFEHGGILSIVNSVVFSPDGSRVVSGGSDGIKLWDVDNDQPIRTFSHDSSVNSVGFNHDGSRVVSGGSDGMKLWDVDNDQPIRTFSHDSIVKSVDFNHDGSRIVSGDSDGMIKLWDVDNDQPIRTFSHDSSVHSVDFNHDGSRVVSGGFDVSGSFNGTVKIWDIDNGQLIHTSQHGSSVYSVGFNHDGSSIVVADGKKIEIYDLQVARKKEVFDWFKSHLRPDQAVIIKRAYETKLRGKKLFLKGDGVDTFETMPDYVRSLLIKSLDISILR